jgi:hypothetical protein
MNLIQRHPLPPQPDPDADSARQDPPPASSPAEVASDDAPIPYPHDDAILCYRDQRIPLSGRVLHQALWLATHHAAINGIADASGQLWLTWKGSALSGEIRTRL